MILSIITINLNNKVGLQKTIQSVITQTATFFEYIVIDGCSSDGSTDLIVENSNKIAYWVSENDKGIYHAMNKGIYASKGEYLLFLNSGDFFVNTDVIKNVFKTPSDEDLLYGKSNISKDGKVLYTTPHPDNLTLEFFYEQTISHQAAFIRKSLYGKYGYYREDLKIYSDLDFWIRAVILNGCTTKKINITISDFNLDGISGSPSCEEMAKAERKKVLLENIPKRIYVDYEQRKAERSQMHTLYWANSVKVLNGLISFLYSVAVKWNSLKNFHRRFRQ